MWLTAEGVDPVLQRSEAEFAGFVHTHAHHRTHQPHLGDIGHPAQGIEMQFNAFGRDFGRIRRTQGEPGRYAGKTQIADFDRGMDTMTAEIRTRELHRDSGARYPQPQQQDRHRRQNSRSNPPSFHAKRSKTLQG